MNRKHWIIPILFFPITVYYVMGSALLFIIFLIDLLVERLGNYSRFPWLDDHTATEWHDKDVWLTASFPIIWPLLFVFMLLVLVYAIIAAIFRVIYVILEFIWNLIVDLLTNVWKAAISPIEYLRDSITSGSKSQEYDNQPGPKQTTILIISFSLFCISCLACWFIIRNPQWLQNIINQYSSQISTVTLTPTVERKTVRPSSTTTLQPVVITITPNYTFSPTSEEDTMVETTTPTPSPAGFVAVTVKSANLRSGPGTNYGWVGNAEKGDELAVYARNKEGSWLQLDWMGKVWIHVSLVESKKDILDFPISALNP